MYLKAMTTQSLTLRFFDLDVTIRSDSETYLDHFVQLYRRFQVNGDLPLGQRAVEFAVLTRSDNAWGRPVLILDGEVHPLPEPRLPVGYVYQSILCAILARVRSHILIHAGVVAHRGQGIILAADSFHGKTTLVLELVRRGFKFLSDETAALGRTDGRVHLFPRSLSLRPGSLELAGFSEAIDGAPEWLGKLLLDVEQIRPGSLGQAAAISYVIILQDPAEAGEGAELPESPGHGPSLSEARSGLSRPEEGAEQPESSGHGLGLSEARPGLSGTGAERAGSSNRELNVLVDRMDEVLLAAIRDIDGVSGLRVDVERSYPWLRFRTVRPTRVFSQIETLCQERRILVLDVNTGPTGQPGFTVPARLEAIPRSQAVVELLRRFQGGYKSAIVQEELGGNSTRLFMELAALTGQANCYRLDVGPLAEMGDLICGLFSPIDGVKPET